MISAQRLSDFSCAEAEADAVLRAYDAMSEMARTMFRLKLKARNLGAVWTPDYERMERWSAEVGCDQ